MKTGRICLLLCITLAAMPATLGIGAYGQELPPNARENKDMPQKPKDEAAAKSTVIFFDDFDNCKPGEKTPNGNTASTASSEKHVLGKVSACIDCFRNLPRNRDDLRRMLKELDLYCGEPPSIRNLPPKDMMLYEYIPLKWEKEFYLRWYLYLNKEFDLPDVSDGYWPAPACFGLTKGEGWALHFMTDQAVGIYTSTYIAKAGKGFRIIILSQENPPENREKWLAEVTPEFKKNYEAKFPWASPKWNGGSKYEFWKGQDWQVWNPNYVWIYGAKDGERKAMLDHERWYCVELHVKAATGPGKKDGVVEFWLDGKNIVSRKDLNNNQGTLSKAKLRAGIADHDHPALGSKIYIDNVVVDSGQYIGPIGNRADLKEREAGALESLKSQERRNPER